MSRTLHFIISLLATSFMFSTPSILAADISGRVFEDTNRNGFQDNAEAGIQSVVLYLDLNFNGKKDTAETTTATTDASGDYTFSSVADGDYRVAVDVSSAPISGRGVTYPSYPLRKRAKRKLGTGKFGDVWGAGNVAVMGTFTGNGVVQIFDISDPDNPILASEWDDNAPLAPATVQNRGVSVGKRHKDSGGQGSQFEDVVLKNDVLYVASNNGEGIHLVDLRNPKFPRTFSHITGSLPVNGPGANSVHTLYVDGNYLYFATNSTLDVFIFDISDPLNPVRKWKFQADAPAEAVRIHEVTARNGKLYMAINPSAAEETSAPGGVVLETEVWDVSDVANTAPTLITSFNSKYSTHTTWGTDDGKHVISAREPYPWEGAEGDVSIWDIDDPQNPVEKSRLNASDMGFGDVTSHIPFTVGNLLYVSWYWAGVKVFDIKDPANPVLIGGYDTSEVEDASGDNGFSGCWGVYPFLGPDKVLASDFHLNSTATQNGLVILARGVPCGHYLEVQNGADTIYNNFGIAAAADTAPTVSIAAVADQTVPADGDTVVNLDGTVVFSGVDGTRQSIRWLPVICPGAVEFGSDDQADTSVTFHKAGRYTFALIASDGMVTSKALIEIFVDDRFEANDSKPVAQAIQRGPYANLQLLANDEDWFKIDVVAGETLIAGLFFSDAKGDLDIELQDAGGATLTTGITTTDNEKVTWVNNTGSTESVHVRIYGKASTDENHYQLFLRNAGAFLVSPHDQKLTLERISGASGGDANFIDGVGQMAFGPDGRLYTTGSSNSSANKIISFAYSASGVLSDKKVAVTLSHCLIGIAFHGNIMYVTQSDGHGSSPPINSDIIRLSDDNQNGLYGEGGETNVKIVMDLRVGHHIMDQLQIKGDTLYVGIGTYSKTALDTGDPENAYTGTICFIPDLTQVPNTENAAILNIATGEPYTSTANNKLRVHSSGARNPYGLTFDKSGTLWMTNNESRSTPDDSIDPEFKDEPYDQLFKTAPKGDYGFANGAWRDNPIATGAGFFNSANKITSTTADNREAPFTIHDPANPVGLGPSSSANGFTFATKNALPAEYRGLAYISRFGNPWNGGAFITETGKGFRVLRFGDVVSVDVSNGSVKRIVDGLNVPLDVIEDPDGNLLIADFYTYAMDTKTGGIYRISASGNVEPELEAIGNKNIAEGALLSFPLSASDADNDALTFSAQNLPTGASLDANSGAFSWTPGFTQAGNYSVTFKVTAGGMEDSETVTITVTNTNRSPVFVSTPNADPSSAELEQTITFSALANDPDGGSVSYAWTFGDGSGLSGASVQHAYVTVGTFTVTLTVTDQEGATTSTTLSVSIATNGSQPGDDPDGDGIVNSEDDDDDNDGVSDANELADGTDPVDPMSFTASPLQIIKMIGKMRFDATGRDAVLIKGSFTDLPTDFDPAGLTLSLNIGGTSAEFPLDLKGKSKTASGIVRIKLKKVRPAKGQPKTFPGGAAPFIAKLKRGTFAPDWADEGIDPATAVKDKPITMQVTLFLNGRVYTTTVSSLLTVKAQKAGKFK